ncbi:hypothetical protein, partial [Staphylococcus pettenkoferi]|uniref:hypothetical protein n=1 Tax=Staphylococcus pettenkoferi TaxID=170573 RepID=UPI001C92F442
RTILTLFTSKTPTPNPRLPSPHPLSPTHSTPLLTLYRQYYHFQTILLNYSSSFIITLPYHSLLYQKFFSR